MEHVRSLTKLVKLKIFIFVTKVTYMNSLPKSSSGYKIVQPLNKTWGQDDSPYRIVPSLNKPLSEDEIQFILNQSKNKLSPEEIARKLNRQVSEVRSRLKVIAAGMYINDKIPYDKIHEVTGVEKSSFIITPSSSRKSVIDTEDNINTSIYEFDSPSSEVDTMIKVGSDDTLDEMTFTVSRDSPFSVKSLCEHISTPIFTTCSRFAAKLAGIQNETLFITNQNQH
jgi:hypothetical protein